MSSSRPPVHPHSPGVIADDRPVLQELTDPDLPGWRVRIVGNDHKYALPPEVYAVLLDYHWLGQWYRSRLQQGYVLTSGDMFEALASAAQWLEKAREQSRVKERPSTPFKGVEGP